MFWGSAPRAFRLDAISSKALMSPKGPGVLLVLAKPSLPASSVALVFADQGLGVKPELEVFDTGNLWFAETMIDEGLVDAPYWLQLCLSIPYGTPMDVGILQAMVNRLPEQAEFTSFGLGAMQMPMVAQSIMLGGHVRVGLEDNLYLERGVLATNEQLVAKAVKIIELMGARVQTAAEARETLQLNR